METERARSSLYRMGFPSDEECKSAVSNSSLKQCPVTTEAVKNAEAIFRKVLMIQKPRQQKKTHSTHSIILLWSQNNILVHWVVITGLNIIGILKLCLPSQLFGGGLKITHFNQYNSNLPDDIRTSTAYTSCISKSNFSCSLRWASVGFWMMVFSPSITFWK